MKVYIVKASDCGPEGFDIAGVFTSNDKAETFVSEEVNHYGFNIERYQIEPYEVY